MKCELDIICPGIVWQCDWHDTRTFVLNDKQNYYVTCSQLGIFTNGAVTCFWTLRLKITPLGHFEIGKKSGGYNFEKGNTFLENSFLESFPYCQTELARGRKGFMQRLACEVDRGEELSNSTSNSLSFIRPLVIEKIFSSFA